MASVKPAAVAIRTASSGARGLTTSGSRAAARGRATAISRPTLRQLGRRDRRCSLIHGRARWQRDRHRGRQNRRSQGGGRHRRSDPAGETPRRSAVPGLLASIAFAPDHPAQHRILARSGTATGEKQKAAHFRDRFSLEYGVDDGARTHDHWNHNPGLYQLSYVHHCDRFHASPDTGPISLSFGHPPRGRFGAPRRIRTPGLRIRSPLLYPTELSGRKFEY